MIAGFIHEEVFDLIVDNQCFLSDKFLYGLELQTISAATLEGSYETSSENMRHTYRFDVTC